jgi:transketolase
MILLTNNSREENNMNISELKNAAKNVRAGIIEAVCSAKSGHPGGSLSVADILTVLYFDKMNIDPKNPKWEDRDRLVLSKGHVAPALYAVLAERGYFPKEKLLTLRKLGSMLQGHPDMKSTPGVDMSTGSLGQGLSVANGMALAAKLDKKDYRVYVILGDGEIQEGQIWEAAMSAAHYKLDNVTAILDNNGLQIDGPNEEVMNINPIDDKFAAFGWNVIKVEDGHDLEAIGRAVDEAKSVKGKPSIIIAKTVKGKCVSYMENQCAWHGTAPNDEQKRIALEDIERGEL